MGSNDMGLSVKQWTKVKKSHKKLKIPTTGLTPALKKYEKADASMGKKLTGPNLDATRKAFEGVKEAVADAIELLEKHKDAKKLSDLAGDLRRFQTGLTYSKTEKYLQEKLEELELAGRRAAAATTSEAEYEERWLAWEKFSKGTWTLARFAEGKGLLDACDAAADTIIDEGREVGSVAAPLVGKYNKQKKILAKVRADLDGEEAAYRGALTQAIVDRQALLRDMEACVEALTDIEEQVGDVLVELDWTPAKVGEVRAELADLRARALEAYEGPNSAFAPQTKIRNSLDIKAAGIHSDDLAPEVTPLFTELITVNKKNGALKKAIEAGVADLEKELDRLA